MSITIIPYCFDLYINDGISVLSFKPSDGILYPKIPSSSFNSVLNLFHITFSKGFWLNSIFPGNSCIIQ